MLACEANRFKLGELEVVRWSKRTSPGKRKIPKDLDLAILARGRIRLPFDSIWWLIEKAASPADADDWPARLPLNIDEVFPEVNVTIELFIEQRRLATEEFDYQNIFESYLRRRHKHELPDCDFFLLDYRQTATAKTSVESDLKLDLWGLRLDGLYSAAGVPTRHDPGNKERHVLLVYVSFPSELEQHLLPLGSPNRPKPIDTTEIRDIVWGLIGYAPDEFTWQDFKTWFWRIRVAYGGRGGGGGGLLSAILSGQRDIDGAIGSLAGRAYALMDMAIGVDPLDFSLERLQKGLLLDGFRSGYAAMTQHLISIDDRTPEAAYWVGRALDRLAGVQATQRAQAMGAIYEALYAVARAQSNEFYRLSIQTTLKRYCVLTYPHRSVVCGPEPR